eukprot:TRINITY_DN33762_c0_g1_i1.p1 TRINITY_DN33762_c0_g1~~TRINITY_DN33762_c0_g1_i1.p1  ORF type:complete len:177 (-),score=35.76 TRINITY_DN33762_c0_g1_i1:17-547(-)
MAPAVETAEEWLAAMRDLVAETADRSRSALPPLPDMTGASRSEKAVFLFMRGIGAAELGDMSTAETMVRYAIKVCPELSAPMSKWPSWARDITRQMVKTQTGSAASPEEIKTGKLDPAPETVDNQAVLNVDDAAEGPWQELLLPALTAACVLACILGIYWSRSDRKAVFSHKFTGD